VYLQLMLSSQD